MCLCLGPVKSGKTLLMKRLQGDAIDDATQTISTNGLNFFLVKNEQGQSGIIVREIGGNMAPLWKHYLEGVQKVIYVMDASNLCQISAVGILLYSLLVNPKLANASFVLVLSKMDLSYRQMRNEALLVLHFARLKRETRQNITIIETSSVTGQGIEDLRKWILQQKNKLSMKINSKQKI
ncbi:ADP-ribosylation factor-like protein 16 [Belonocnema kinseyi]|uniref:ADP-ribosylation factor-like protein 16 n=1 Tax=Belonocnema kinseyi TaxID=2817044 RepID=UPI00143CE7B0|nr:ADP-ribosylation factor-like protein 16 [Belonocnema kinseyi]